MGDSNDKGATKRQEEDELLLIQETRDWQAVVQCVVQRAAKVLW